MSQSKLFLSIFLPFWSVELYKKKNNYQIKEPVLITEVVRGKEVVVRASAQAKLLGISPGILAADAKAMLLNPSILNFDPQYEEKALLALSHWSSKFSPFVAPESVICEAENYYYDPRISGLYLDVSGSKRLFASYEKLIETVSYELALLGFSCRLAITPSYGASWALARYGTKRSTVIEEQSALRSTLAPLPVSSLRLSKELQQALCQLNITRVEHLFSLPTAELNKRFGSVLSSRLKICLAKEQHPIVKTIRLPKKEVVTLVFDGLLVAQDSLLQAARQCLRELLTKLTSKEKTLSALRISIKPDRRLRQDKLFLFNQPTVNFKHIIKVVSPWLENFLIGLGLEELSLIVERHALVDRIQTEYLYHSTSSAIHADNEKSLKNLGELLDNLSCSIGAYNIKYLHTHQTYLPEQSFSYQPGACSKGLNLLLSADRPSLLFEVPEPISIIQMLPDHFPRSLTWHKKTYQLEHCSGPERISLPWWQGRLSQGQISQEKRLARDYFKVKFQNGPSAWIFKESKNTKWFIHGLWT